LWEKLELMKNWSNGRDLKGFPKPLRSLKDGRIGSINYWIE
jgi:hypothetical protein